MNNVNLCPIKIFAGIILGLSLWSSSVNAQSPSALWENKVEVKRVDKPKRTPPKPRPKPTIVKRKPVVIESTPRLALRWSVQKREQGKTIEPANPEENFKVGDYLRLVIEVNQDGYLYILQEGQGTMIFPDKRIMGGANKVTKGEKIVIPSNCDKEIDAKDQCWFEVEDKDDDLTIIFSRDRIDDLPNSVDETGTTIFDKEKLAEVKKISTKSTSKEFSKTRFNKYTVQYTNLNREDNEDLIIETKIRHK